MEILAFIVAFSSFNRILYHIVYAWHNWWNYGSRTRGDKNNLMYEWGLL